MVLAAGLPELHHVTSVHAHDEVSVLVDTAGSGLFSFALSVLYGPEMLVGTAGNSLFQLWNCPGLLGIALYFLYKPRSLKKCTVFTLQV